MKSVPNVYLGGSLWLLAAALIYGVFPTIPFHASFTLLVFCSATILWVFSALDATLVALLAVLALAASGVIETKAVLSGLGDPFITFVIAGFMLGGAYKSTGLSDVLARWFVARAARVDALFYLVTLVLLLLSFVIPATSARAALMLPIYMVLAQSTTNSNVRKGLAVLFPTIIVLSCVTSYLGAAANLMTVEFIEQYFAQKISYSEWLVLGLPFGLASCFISTWVILHVFLNKQERTMPFQFVENGEKKPETAPGAMVKVVFWSLVLMIGWATEAWHGINAGLLAFGGAMALCLPGTGVISFKTALKEVEWSLVIFMAATIELSQALISSGLVAMFLSTFSSSQTSGTQLSVLLMILLMGLFSHLIINSRTARAAVLLPVLVPLGVQAGYAPVVIAFFSNAAMGYCLTLPICAKPVAMFSAAGVDGYTTRDLLRLSAWLLPIHFLLLLLACKWY
jgi:anion transporter